MLFPSTNMFFNISCSSSTYITQSKVAMQEKLSEVYAFFVLQCTVFGRKSKHKTDVTALKQNPFSHKKAMKYSGRKKLICEVSKLSKFNAFNLPGY